jgi:tRNA(Arg) A34 adenosine deaminase TadA
VATICDISLNKLVPRRSRNALQVAQVPRVRELVEVQNGNGVILHLLQNKIGSNKTRSAGDENPIWHAKNRCSREAIQEQPEASEVSRL